MASSDTLPGGRYNLNHYTLLVPSQADVFVRLYRVFKRIQDAPELLPELGDIICYFGRFLPVHNDALDKTRNLFHLALLHPKARRLWHPYPHSAGVHVVPASLDVARQQLSVQYNARLFKILFDGAAVTKLGHINRDLV